MKILVIGSKDHDRAKSIDWLQPFPNIEEYDSVVIDLQSLTSEQFNKIQTKFRDIRESIARLVNTNREVFCIMSTKKQPTLRTEKGFKVRYAPLFSNYDWLPINIIVSSRIGKSITILDQRFEKYFNCVRKWKYEYGLNDEEWDEVGETVWIMLNLNTPIEINAFLVGYILSKTSQGQEELRKEHLISRFRKTPEGREMLNAHLKTPITVRELKTYLKLARSRVKR